MLATHQLKQGKGVPLVFLHGFLGTSNDWSSVCAKLPASHCIGVDLPGHGASPFTERFFEEMPLFDTPIHLVGYSMGARLAMQYKVRFPEKVASLILLSAHPGLKTDKEKQERLIIDETWAQRLLDDPWDLFLTAWYSQPLFGGFVPDPSFRKGERRGDLAQSLLFYSLARQTYAKPNGLYLVGEKDLKFQSLHPDAIVIPDAAHAVHLENPQAVAEEIERFIGV